MPPRFLDTNILIRYFTKDDELKAEKALALLQKAERGEEKLYTSPMVIFEIVYTLYHSYKQPRAKIRDLLLPILALKSLALPNKQLYRNALDIYVDKNISFADSFNVAYMQQQKSNEVYS